MPYTTVTTTYEVVREVGRKSVRCPRCSTRYRRQSTFTQTINPWNRLPDGTAKSRKDIRAELAVCRDAWIADTSDHGCEVG